MWAAVRPEPTLTNNTSSSSPIIRRTVCTPTELDLSWTPTESVLYSHCFLLYRVSQKSSPPTTFDHIFARVESFCIKFCTLIGSLYPHTCMSTDFHLFILKFNDMVLILLWAPIIFTVSSFDCSAISLLYKNAEYQRTGNDVIVFVIKCLMFYKQMIVWFFCTDYCFTKCLKLFSTPMGKLSYGYKLRIQTFREQGFGAKSIISSYADHKG